MMKSKIVRGFILGFGGFFLALYFQNCSSYSNNSLYNGLSLSAAQVAVDNSKPSIQIQSARSRVRAHESFFEIGGTCNTASYKMGRMSVRLYQIIDSQTQTAVSIQASGLDSTVILDYLCEDGKFSVVIPRLPGAMNFGASLEEVQGVIYVNMDLYNDLLPDGTPNIQATAFPSDGVPSDQIIFERPCDNTNASSPRCLAVLSRQPVSAPSVLKTNTVQTGAYPHPAYEAPCKDVYTIAPQKVGDPITYKNSDLCINLGMVIQ